MDTTPAPSSARPPSTNAPRRRRRVWGATMASAALAVGSAVAVGVAVDPSPASASQESSTVARSASTAVRKASVERIERVRAVVDDRLEVARRAQVARERHAWERAIWAHRVEVARIETQRRAEAAARAEAVVEPTSSVDGSWSALAQCESGGNWAINTGNGYYGGLQFSLSTWQAFGGSGYPHRQSSSAQVAVAERVLAAQGWGAWPACSSKLGLR